MIIYAWSPAQSLDIEVSGEPSAVLTKTDKSGVAKATVLSKDYGKNQNLALKITQGNVSFFIDNEVIQVLEDITTFASLKEAVETNFILKSYFEVSTTAPSSVVSDTYAVLPFAVEDNVPTMMESFVSALDLTATYNKSFVVSQFTGEAYHQAMLNYCLNTSEYECHTIAGSDLGLTPTQIKQQAANLNSETAILAYPGVYLNFTGETKLYDGTYFAAKVAGLAAGLSCEIPLTRKLVSVQGFEDIDFEGQSEKAVRESLIDCGVLFGLYKDSLGFTINKGINTIQGQNNRPLLGADNKTCEISISRIRYQMQKEIRISADAQFPGNTRLKPSKLDVAQFYADYFNSKVGTYLTGWDSSTLKIWLQEDAWWGEAKVFVNSPVNFVFFTLSFALDNNI